MTNYLNTCKTFDPFSPLAIENKSFGISQMLRKISFYYNRSKQREHLRTLEPRLLRDIGVTLEQAESEASKPFWKD